MHQNEAANLSKVKVNTNFPSSCISLSEAQKENKWFSEEALQIAEKRREVKGKGEKERYTHLNAAAAAKSLQ